MYMTEITESRFDELVENAEKMLRYGGKVMSCLDSIQRGSDRMGERSPMPDYRDKWRGDRSHSRDRDRDMDDYEQERYGERYGGGYNGGRRY